MKKIVIIFGIIFLFFFSFETDIKEFYIKGDFLSLKLLLDSLKGKNIEPSSSLYFYIAEISNDLTLSLNCYKTVEENYKDSPFYTTTLLRLAKYYSLIRDTSKALTYYRKLISLKEKNILPYAYLGIIGIYENYADIKSSNYWITSFINEVDSSPFLNYFSLNEKNKHSQAKEKFYSIQIGSFKSKDNADKLFKTYKDKSYDVFVVFEENLYKVRIGKFKNEQDAKSFLKIFQKAETLPAWIVYGE
uniref:SPOR domain-containing protein n=1 Tax=candidate division WOR-3 bacterium TaxID=2052148 RepID=A0A7C3NCR9_UNCW3